MGWKVKAAVQAILAKIPYGRQINHHIFQRRISKAFSKEAMMQGYRVQIKHILDIQSRYPLQGKSIMEIGPGWYSISGVVFWLLNSKCLHWVDVERQFKLDLLKRYATTLLENVQEVAEDLSLSEIVVEKKLIELLECETDEEYFLACNIIYEAPGDAKAIKCLEGKVDLIYSYGVLEHVDWGTLEAFFAQSKSQLSDAGRHYHNIGLHDHFHTAGLGNGVNFLKYPQWAWSIIAGNAFAFHNRKRKSDYLRLVNENNFHIYKAETELLDLNLVALDAIKVHKDFECYEREDLACSHLYLECGLERPFTQIPE